MMDRCLQCNATLKADETACYTCGSVRQPKDQKPNLIARCAGLIKILFIASGLLTVASLFFSATPSFITCLTTTIILLFVNRSAEQMIEKHKH